MTDLTPIEGILLWIPMVSLLFYVPVVCWLDVKWREIPHSLWLPLWIVNLPVIAYLYHDGVFPSIWLIMSFIMCGIFWVMHQANIIQGADTLWLWAISMFFVVKPWPQLQSMMQVMFYLYLILAMVLTALVLLVLNYRRGYRDSPLQMLSRYEPHGVPLVLTISAALIMAVVL